MAKILLTGASGFVGKALSRYLCIDHSVIAPTRVVPSKPIRNIKYSLFPDISNIAESVELFSGVDVVIHVAALAHSVGADPSAFKCINTDATLSLARQAARLGVKRFLFLSTIGVNGSRNNNCPFNYDDAPAPADEYSVSKYEAEKGLRIISRETGMEVVIIRPPLVYGPGAPGNFGRLVRLAKMNVPLPLGAVHNKRSFVSIDNLIDLISVCVSHPDAANHVFLVSDDRIVSTTELLRMMISAAGEKTVLIPIPMSLLRLLGRFMGKKTIVEKLCGDLQVNIDHTKNTLCWVPPVSVEEGVWRCFY